MASNGSDSVIKSSVRSSALRMAVSQKRDLVLERAVLFVGFGAQHLVAKLGDFLILHLHVVFQLLALLLVGGERGAIRFQAAQVRIQGLFNLRDVLWVR